MCEDDVNIRLNAPKRPLTFLKRISGQDDLTDPVAAVRVGTDSISGLNIK